MRKTILTMAVDGFNFDEALDRILSHCPSRGGRGGYACVSNVHMCMETFDSMHFRNVVNEADVVVPDGRPIFWAQRLMGARYAEQVRGQDITNALCNESATSGLKIGLYGGVDDDVLALVESNLKSNFGAINIAYRFSPPFRPLTDVENKLVCDAITKADVDVLFVGIGCPKQEVWMAMNKPRLSCMMLGVGAAFDFIAGHKRHAPKWMQFLGLEWFFRLCCEPRRLWQRYLVQNPRFIYYFFQQLFFKRIF